MIPKRQNHTLPNLMAAAPCELMVADFADFRFVTEHAAKCANLHFGCVTIKKLAFRFRVEYNIYWAAIYTI